MARLEAWPKVEIIETWYKTALRAAPWSRSGWRYQSLGWRDRNSSLGFRQPHDLEPVLGESIHRANQSGKAHRLYDEGIDPEIVCAKDVLFRFEITVTVTETLKGQIVSVTVTVMEMSAPE